MKKTAVASAVALATTLASGPVWAATTTIGGHLAFDRTEVEACGKINIAVSGLNVQGETDTQGGAEGSTIMASIKSNKGEIRGGSVTQSAPKPGYFASSQKYISLENGNARAFIWYPCDQSGEDSVDIRLLERFRLESGSYSYKQIAGTTQLINIKPVPQDPKGLAIASFTPDESDMHGMDGECSSLWNPEYPCAIEGYMTAGQSGGKIVVKAKNEFATGTVKVTVTYHGHGDEEVPEPQSYTANMADGEAIVTLDNQLTKAGEYYLEATMEGVDGSSVGLVYPDKLKVVPTGIPEKLSLWADKQRIANPKFGNFPAGSQIAQGTKVKGHLLDAYGNMTSNCVPERNEETGVVTCTASGDINVAIVDSSDNDDLKSIFAEGKLGLHIPAGSATGMVVAKTGDAIIGNESGELAWNEGKPKTGAIKLVGTAKDSSGKAISTIANSDPLDIKVVGGSLSAVIDSGFQNDQLANNTFNAFGVTVIDTQGKTIGRAGDVKVKSTKTMEEYETAPDQNNIVHVRLKKQTWGDKQYLISDVAGNYAQVLVEGSAIVPSVIKKVEFHNANGQAITDVPPAEITADKKYIVRIPESSFKMYDEFGNMLTGEQPLTSDKVGIFTVSTSNAAGINYPSGSSGVPGRFMKVDGKPSHVHLVYDATGSKAFAGQDTINLNFSRGTINEKPNLTSTIPAYHGLASIKSHLAAINDTIPVNSEAAMTVEMLDKEGKRFVDPDPAARTNITLNIGGPEGDSVIVEPTVTEIWWQAMTVTEGVCEQVEGTFTNGVCSLTEEQCQGEILAGLWMGGKCHTMMERQLGDGANLDFHESMGRKVLVINAGPDKGKFSLTFTSADNNEITETRIFTVSKSEPQPCVPGSTDEKTECNYEDQCEAALGLFTDGQCKAAGLLKAESSLGGTVDAAFGGGILAQDDEDGAYQQIKKINIDEPILVEGVFKVNEEDVGQPANILVAVFHIDPTNSNYAADEGFGWFQLVGCNQNSFDCPNLGWKAERLPHGEDGLPQASSLKPFDLVDSLPKYYTVPIYGGTLSVPGELWLYFGYSVKNTGSKIGQSFQPGKIVRNVCPIMIVANQWISDATRQYFLCESGE